jgi:hypothetical protein
MNQQASVAAVAATCSITVKFYIDTAAVLPASSCPAETQVLTILLLCCPAHARCCFVVLQAFVDFENYEEAVKAMREKDHKVFNEKFGDRYVRLIQVCSCN